MEQFTSNVSCKLLKVTFDAQTDKVRAERNWVTAICNVKQMWVGAEE